MTDAIRALGGEVRARHAGRAARSSRTAASREVVAGGERIEPGHVISSLPLRTTVAISAARTRPPRCSRPRAGLRYRDFLTVALVLDGEDLFPDNWIYIHDPGVRVGRIQNYRSWSPWMVPDPTKACVGLEYFCFAGDELWTMGDDELVELATTRARAARPGAAVEGRARLRRPRPEGVPDLRRRLRRARRDDPRRGSTGSRTSSRSAATASTATTTPTTRC